MGRNESQNAQIQAIGYAKKLSNAARINQEMSNFQNKLVDKGYINAVLWHKKVIQDSIFEYQFDLGTPIKFIHIYIGTNKSFFPNSPSDTLVVNYEQIATFLKQTTDKLATNGFPLSKVNLQNKITKNQTLIADLIIEPQSKRFLNDIIIKGYDVFPAGIKKYLIKKYQNKTLNQQLLESLHQDFAQLGFVKSMKFPELLFTEKTSKVFVYLNKSNNNTFDGLIGFSNNDNQKLQFNGNLDLGLQNFLNQGEILKINWKSDGKQQKTFLFDLELPYIFKTPLTSKTQIHILKQDSTFQTTKLALDLGFALNLKTKIFVGIQNATSTQTLKTANTNGISYQNQFYVAQFDFQRNKIESFLDNTYLHIAIGNGNRQTKNQTNQQQFLALNAHWQLLWKDKHGLSLKTQNFYLQSNTYFTNELYRFGGIKSIRGFLENSLQAHLVMTIITEYQYVISPTLYVHTITDYGFFEDKTTQTTGKLFGLGLGFGLKTKNGWLKMNYANGTVGQQNIKNSSALIHLSLTTTF
ncbi:membrane protein [Flavobacterium branchiophilum NBRC 15030 = ATCC 35035]|nr:membrane protein [Flavobacterium branchiophilum NBRC 15030 = ATCC 35035]